LDNNKNTNNYAIYFYYGPSASRGSSNMLGAFSSNMARSLASGFFAFFFPLEDFLGFAGSPSTTGSGVKRRIKNEVGPLHMIL